MLELPFIALYGIAMFAVNLCAVVMSHNRPGSSQRSLAFYVGLCGVCMIPIVIIGAFGLAAQTLFASFLSTAGITFLASLLVLLTCTVASLYFCMSMHRNRRAAPTNGR